tara:strand:+ start:3642 stop:4319 length:678 start_codon:yes stop_codon:yes gene_type:complete
MINENHKMKTVSKLFGRSHCLHLTCPNEKDEVIKNVYQNTNIELPERSRNLKKLDNHNISILKNGYYAVGIPSDLDMFIYFTKHNNKNCCFIICRELNAGFSQPKILVVYPKCKDTEVYNGTLIEATRVYATDNRFCILLTDVQWFKGEKQSHKNFIERLQVLGEFLKNEYIENLKQFPFRLQIATPYQHLNLLEQRLKNLPYKIDRILFVPPYKKQSGVFYYNL